MGSSVIDHNKLATKWFFGAGAAALVLCLFLVWADDYLSNSKGEEQLRQSLHTLRTAQSSIPSRVTDERQIQAGHFSGPRKVNSK